MNGEIVFTNTENEPWYKLINFENGSIFAVEIMTLSGNILCDSTWLPGDACCGLFALTKDEFMLKDSDVKSLDELIKNLYNKLPKDRLVDAFYLSPDKQRREMHPRHGCETMDDNKYEKYRQRAVPIKFAIPFLNSVDKVYMIYDEVTTDRLPSITWNGCANIFTKREYAEKVLGTAEIETLAIKELSKADFDKQVKTWHAFGIQRFNLNAGSDDYCCTIMRDDYMPDPIAKEWEYSGSALCASLWRYRQYANYKDNNMKALAQSLFNMFCHELKTTLFLIPFAYDSEELPILKPDYVIHTTNGSVSLITKKFLSKRIENADELLDSQHEFKVSTNGEQVLPVDDIKFFGGEKYKFAKNIATQPPRKMQFLTVNGPEGTFVPAFTDFGTLHSIFGENVRVSVITYDELRDITLNDSVLNGVIINPNSATMPIWKKDMDTIEKVSQGEKTFYVNKSTDTSNENKQQCGESLNKEDKSHDKKPSKGIFGKLKDLFR